ncbi:Putative disease resistance RGA4 [Gossypium arboreum]|uniref:Putative disease resistance RGA4 n=1 Tax=Gossypium arboreum TaxID=29729 RepID=A0A0B0NAA1_GOSAR|nr:Putative disease resistance RGA4 [Gossypium arboreum]
MEEMRCKMHDLMHDLAESVAGMESSIIDSNKIASDVGEKCRHISINPSVIPLFKGKKLRTLLRSPYIETPNLSEETWDFIIANCRCLRVLELNVLNFKTISPSIYKLKHLRYLDLSWNSNIKILPKSICKIQNLLALKLDGCYELQELPKKIEKLVNLTHLPCCSCFGLTHMPRGIGKLTSLETLSLFVVDKDGSHGGADLSELRLINNLRGELRIDNLGFVKNAKEKFMAANLKEKQHLRSLVLLWSDGNDDDDDEKSLEDLQPHPNLKELSIGGWRGDAQFPSLVSLLTILVKITIGSSNFKHLPSFAQLPCLKELSIADCTESWWRRTKPIDDDSNKDDTTVMGTTTMAFPCLSSLFIHDCPLTSMPLYPSLDDNLQLRNTSSRPLKQTMKMNTTSTTPSSLTSSLPLSKLKIFYVDNIEGLDTHMADECLQHLTGLKTLEIRDCKEVDLESLQWEPIKNLSELLIGNIPQLVSLRRGLQHLVQLKTLKIRECNGLRSLFPVFQHLTFLEKFEVSNCKELELSAAGIQIFQDHTSLCSLSLENIPKCRHLPEWLQHLTNLQKLYLIDLPNLTSLPDEMRCLTNLESLYIERVSQLEARCRKDMADWHTIAHIPNIIINGLYQMLGSPADFVIEGPNGKKRKMLQNIWWFIGAFGRVIVRA